MKREAHPGSSGAGAQGREENLENDVPAYSGYNPFLFQEVAVCELCQACSIRGHHPVFLPFARDQNGLTSPASLLGEAQAQSLADVAARWLESLMNHLAHIVNEALPVSVYHHHIKLL